MSVDFTRIFENKNMKNNLIISGANLKKTNHENFTTSKLKIVTLHHVYDIANGGCQLSTLGHLAWKKFI